LLVEVVDKPGLLLRGAEFALDRVDGHGILNDLNETTALSRG
jgi:hypothetical protein